MNASALKVSVPKLTPDERQGLQDFWKVYEAHREEITSNLQEIASRHEEFKFILQNTASEPTAEEQDRLNGYSLGANSYVQKPVDFDQFIGVVCQLGLYWLILNEAPPRQ